MNQTEVAAVLAFFSAAWPAFQPDHNATRVWMAECEDLDVTVAEQAMRQVVRTSDYPATIARFRVACQEIAMLRRQNRALPAAQLEPAPWPADLVASMKRMAKEGGARAHWHGGPDPCPVCGGMQISTRKKALQRPDPAWCSRCGSYSMPHSAAIEAKQVDSMEEHPDQIRKPKANR